jgi:hypothetical protein
MDCGGPLPLMPDTHPKTNLLPSPNVQVRNLPHLAPALFVVPNHHAAQAVYHRFKKTVDAVCTTLIWQ